VDGASSGLFARERTQKLGHDDVGLAERRLAGRIWKTPVVRCERLEELSGARLWMKSENLQRGGSFKIRGALLAVERLARSGSRGVIAQSTGNHAISVALAAREFGLDALAVLPTDAAPTKARRIEELGARVVYAGTTLADRVAAVGELRRHHGYDVVDPYDDPQVVAGQGTATAELIRQVAGEGRRLDAVVVPIGGGSAIAGACLAATEHEVAVIGAEPEAVPAFTAARHAGEPVTVPVRPTMADGLRPDRVGDLPFDLSHRTVVDVITVPEAAIAEALVLALLHARVLIEPAAATALAAALRHASDLGADVGVLLTGGNIEPDLVGSLLADHESAGHPR
jgi:threo-3-hydroxy-L-aspartate ammonia-lyase